MAREKIFQAALLQVVSDEPVGKENDSGSVERAAAEDDAAVHDDAA